MENFDEKKERMAVLKEASVHRAREVMMHQINIDNYEAAIAKIAQDEEMLEFKDDLERRLIETRREIKKEKILLAVINEQIRMVR